MMIIILIMVLMHSCITNAVHLTCGIGISKGNHFWQNKAKDYAEKLCENMGYPNKKGGLNPFEKKDPEFEECVKIFEPFLKEREIEEKDAENYGKYCKKHEVNAHDAKEMLKTLEPYCWKMSDVANLPVLMNYYLINITPEDWNNLQYDNMQLETCINYIKTEDKTKSGSGMNLLENYKKMFSKNGYSKCNCMEVIGFNDVYNKLNGNDEFGSLKLFYNEVCFKCAKRRQPLTKSQLEGISSTDISSPKAQHSKINLKKIVKFLDVAEPILMSGWFTKDDINTQWPLSYLIENSQINDDRFNSDEIRAMAAAISNGYSFESYAEFLRLITKDELSKTLGSWQCRREIVGVFNLDKDRLKKGYYSILVYGNDKEATKTANRLLELFINFAPPSISCRDFVDEIKKITNIFYNGRIFYKGDDMKKCTFVVRHDEIFKFLNASLSSKRSLRDVLNCMKLIEGTEKEFDSGKDDLIGNPNYLNEPEYDCFKALLLKDFTKKIFENHHDEEICKTQILDYEPVQNKEKIFNLYRKLYNIETEFHKLSRVFEYKVDSKLEEAHIKMLK